MDWLYPLCGFVVGALVGLTGMGGGSLMTPLLILLFGVHPLTAVGTDLLFAATTKTAGTAIHSKNGNVDWRVAGSWLPDPSPRRCSRFGPHRRPLCGKRRCSKYEYTGVQHLSKSA